MAGGSGRARRRARVLAAPDRGRQLALTGLSLAALLVVTGCAENAATATLAPAPTLPVVTATPGPPPVPTPGQQQRYVVREGDTLSGIAARFSVSEDAILKANSISDRDRLYAGQELIIPPSQP